MVKNNRIHDLLFNKLIKMNKMKNSKNLVYMVVALFCATTIFISNSCTKPDKVVGTFIIKGYLYDSCGGAPMNNVPLQVSFKSDRLTATKTVDDDNIGKGLTDANGYFEIACKKYNINGTSDLFVSTSRFVLNTEYIPYLTESIDLGKGYMKGIIMKGRVKVKLSGAFTASDTFFIGHPSAQYQYFSNLFDGKEVEYSIQFKHNYSFINSSIDSVGPRYSVRYAPFDTYYGIGRANFKSTNTISYVATTCEMPDTTTSVTITK